MENDHPYLLELRLKNYKSFPGVILGLRPLTVLVGPNGAGKSNILDALVLLSDAMSLQLKEAIHKHGGLSGVRRKKTRGAKRYPKFGIAVHLRFVPRGQSDPVNVHYGFELQAAPNNDYLISRERCLVDLPERIFFDRKEDQIEFDYPTFRAPPGTVNTVDQHALLLPLISTIPIFSEIRDKLASMRRYAISPDVIRELQSPAPGNGLEPDGRNIADVIAEMQRNRNEDYVRLCELLESVVPGVIRVEPVSYGSKRWLRFYQRAGDGGEQILSFDAESMSDGTLRVLGILAAVLQDPGPLLTAIEEPEATIHPGALGALMDILRHGELRSQIMITTHSPDVLDSSDLPPSSIWLVEWREGVSFVSPISPESARALEFSTPGVLLRSNFLRPAEGVITEVDLFPSEFSQ